MGLVTVFKNNANIVVLILCALVVSCDNNEPGPGGPENDFEAVLDIVYPKASLYTDGRSITVRGTSTITDGSLDEIVVDGITATSSDGFATWSAEVPLVLGLNTFSVIANTHEGPVEFTFDDARIIREEFTLGEADYIVHDAANNRVLLTADPLFVDAAIMAVDLSSGAQTVFSSATQTNSGNNFLYPRSITVDTERNRAFVRVSSNLESIDLETGHRTAYDVGLLPGDVAVTNISAMVFDNLNDQLLLLAGAGGKVLISVDPVTAVPSIIEDTVDTNEPIVLTNAKGIEIDETNNRALVLGNNGSKYALTSIDLATGDRTIVSDRNTPNAENLFSFGNDAGLCIDSINDTAYIADANQGVIYEVNLTTGAGSVFIDRTSGKGLIVRPAGIFYDSSVHRVIVFDISSNVLVQIDIATKSPSLVSVIHASTSDIFSADINSLVYDNQNHRLLTTANQSDKNHVLSVDADSGEINRIATAAFRSYTTYQGIALDASSNQLYFEEGYSDSVFSLDLSLSPQSAEDVGMVSTPGFPNYENLPSTLTSLKLDSANDRLVAIDMSAASVQSIDIETGARTILSDNGAGGSGPLMPGPITMDADFANNRVFVVDFKSASLFEVNTLTGDRSLISGPTTPDAVNPFDQLRAVAYDAVTDVNNPRFYVADSSVDAIFLVDAVTGARTILSDNTTPDATNPFNTPSGIQMDLDNNRILISDRGTDQILAVDITTGARTELFTVDSPERFVFDKVGNRAIVSATSPAGLYLYDFGTSQLSDIAPKLMTYSFNHITIDNVNGRALAVDGNEQITSINLTNNTVTSIESSELKPLDIRRIAYDNVNERLLVSSTEAIYAFDVAGNVTSVLSDETTPNADLPFTNLRDIAIDEAGNRVIGIHGSDLISVNLDSGLRAVLSSSTIPNDVNPFLDPEHLVIDSENNRALVLDDEAASLIAVNLIDGSRSVISDPNTPNTFNLYEADEVTEMVLDIENNSVVLALDASPRLLTIDLVSGQRAWLSR